MFQNYPDSRQKFRNWVRECPRSKRPRRSKSCSQVVAKSTGNQFTLQYVCNCVQVTRATFQTYANANSISSLNDISQWFWRFRYNLGNGIGDRLDVVTVAAAGHHSCLSPEVMSRGHIQANPVYPRTFRSEPSRQHLKPPYSQILLHSSVLQSRPT